MIQPVDGSNAKGELWLHGTNAPFFNRWSLPAPQKDALTPQSPALFFTQDLEYASGAGRNLCEVRLDAASKILMPENGEDGSKDLKKALSKDELFGKCIHLNSEEQWIEAWRTGEVMRCGFSSNLDGHKPLQSSADAVSARLAALKCNPISHEKFRNLCILYMTRVWIDLLAQHTKRLGYQALVGQEVDRWYGPAGMQMPPKIRSWMAVLDTTAITPPRWR